MSFVASTLWVKCNDVLVHVISVNKKINKLAQETKMENIKDVVYSILDYRLVDTTDTSIINKK